MPPLTPEQVQQIKGQLRLLMGNATRAEFQAAMAEIDRLAAAADPASAFGAVSGPVAAAFQAWQATLPKPVAPTTLAGRNIATDLTMGAQQGTTVTPPPVLPPEKPPEKPPTGSIPGYRGATLTPAEIAQKVADYKRFIPGITDAEISALLAAEGAPDVKVPIAAQEQSMLRAALARIGVTTATEDEQKSLLASLKDDFQDKYQVGDYEAADFPRYLASVTPDPLRGMLERLRATAALPAATAMQQALKDAEFNRAAVALNRRYPGMPKDLLGDLRPALEALYGQDISPYGPRYGGPAGEDFPSGPTPSFGDWLPGVNLDRVMDAQGVGPEWRLSRLDSAFESTIADPLRKQAQTPQQQQRTEDYIASLRAALPTITTRFSLAQENNPSLDPSRFLQGVEGKGLLDAQAQDYQTQQQKNQIKLADQAKAMAAQRKSNEEIAARLGLSLAALGDVMAQSAKAGQAGLAAVGAAATQAGQTVEDIAKRIIAGDELIAAQSKSGVDALNAIRQQAQIVGQAVVEAQQANLRAQATQQDKDIQAARASLSRAVSQITANPNAGGPEDVARVVGLPIDDIQKLMPEFIPTVQETQRQNQVFNQYQATQRRDFANVDAALKPAVEAGVITDQATLDAYRAALLNSGGVTTEVVQDRDIASVSVPTTIGTVTYSPARGETFASVLAASGIANPQSVRITGQPTTRTTRPFTNDLKAATDQANYVRRQSESAVQRAQSAASGVADYATSALRGFPNTKEAARALEVNMGAAYADAIAGGTATQAQLDELSGLRLFQQEGFIDYLAQNVEPEMAEYARQLAGPAYLSGKAQPPAYLANEQEFLRSRLPQIGTKFQAFQKQQALTKLAPIEADKAFAPTLTQLLTDWGLREPDAKREDLLAKNADAIKKTYDEYQRRSSGAQGVGGYSLAQQRQAIGGGIL